jgi:oligopeptide transport system substrate-binding protein
MDQSPSTLDPAHAANIYANHVVVNAYDTLFSYQYLARPYQLKPNLASGWPEISPDGLEYTIRLKPGVHFVDDPAFPGGIGREVTAADVVYSIQRHFHPATRSQGTYLWQNRIVGLDDWKTAGSDYATPVEGLQALDRHTLRIRLLQPYPQLLYTLAQGYSAIVPREAVEHYGREFAVRPVGSGPFRVTHYDSARITMVRNPKYRQEPSTWRPKATTLSPRGRTVWSAYKGVRRLSSIAFTSTSSANRRHAGTRSPRATRSSTRPSRMNSSTGCSPHASRSR